MRGCQIYKTKENYKIVTMHQTESGIFVLNKPIFILPIFIDNEEFGQALFQCINSSKEVPDSEDSFNKELLSLLKENSFKKLYKKSNSCMLIIENNNLDIIPLRLSKNRGLEEVDEDKKIIDYTKENESFIVATIIEMLNHKY